MLKKKGILIACIVVPMLAVILFAVLMFKKELDAQKEFELEQEAKRVAAVAAVFDEVELADSYRVNDEAHNAIYTQRFGADPGVMVYDGRVYVYSTNDVFEYNSAGTITDNTYGQIDSINCASSDDLVNWTDHGAMKIAGWSGAAGWASVSWAPCATHKTVDGKEVFYLFFANGAGGIGVLTSETPYGPWEDPIGGPLISSDTPNCSDVLWLFDPAVLIDDDGSAYLYFGGGVPDEEYAHPKTARVIKLSDDLLSVEGEAQMIDAPYMFEDSCINKIDGKYYYSYCSNFNTGDNEYGLGGGAVQYMVSDSPMGPFTYVGEAFPNQGQFFGAGGNNHHTIFEFNDQFYLAYHARTLETAMNARGNYRSTHIDTISFADGKFTPAVGTYEGVEQLKDFDPYTKTIASTMSDNGGIEVQIVKNESVLVAETGDWIKLSAVDFKEKCSTLTVNVATEGKSYIKVCTDSNDSDAVSIVEIPNTDGEYQEITVSVNGLTGEKDLFFVFKGDKVKVKDWVFAEK